MATTYFAFLSTPDTLMILAVCLVIFGPRKLPEIARTVGRAIREFRNASDEIVRDLTQEVRTAPRSPQRIHHPESTIAATQIPAVEPVETQTDKSTVVEEVAGKTS